MINVLLFGWRLSALLVGLRRRGSSQKAACCAAGRTLQPSDCSAEYVAEVARHTSCERQEAAVGSKGT
jgi:hypothetical protein